MNGNKLFSEFSLKKIWEKLLQHDKALNSTLLVLPSGNWIAQDGVFINTVTYNGFKNTDKLTVDLYDDETVTDEILLEYEEYIDDFEIINGALIAIANTRPTQTMTVVVKGDFESQNTDIGNFVELFQTVSDGKQLVASAITDMEVHTDATATFEEMAANIRSIESGVDTSGATATAAQITEGFTAWVNGELIIGTRPLPATSHSGTYTTPVIAGQVTYTATITFPTPFDSVPTVSAKAWMNYPGYEWNVNVNILSVTNEKFTCQVKNAFGKDSSSICISWVADAST